MLERDLLVLFFILKWLLLIIAYPYHSRGFEKHQHSLVPRPENQMSYLLAAVHRQMQRCTGEDWGTSAPADWEWLVRGERSGNQGAISQVPTCLMRHFCPREVSLIWMMNNVQCHWPIWMALSCNAKCGIHLDLQWKSLLYDTTVCNTMSLYPYVYI